ncbi:MAG: triose-phosphate isomerase [Candidatus Raymondbacteria bacterium RifOxyA12_full_50_37]|uniref:Triosephosphate isomerase n=1 Tax=Candidatus Raymondbacteria bacterium RIFOXYD12_FULL_49_13 TaxID=1817890 RepID=A0A1F7F149_UNCRA|nr:MAG: triose-phosphate isomerase [Candidatus Raymondbacteria bacterium RifOxyA12_full_50_37]OGJ93307.1 MAG: triose-phosphate isomerase [Candidatus Raymondbacteria bacterium RifOxyC12_full_50_8]OGJ93539.1 MAG: triose-phosphate isomerase [Candidatus Raymondbacteria bacterium RIFOXYA2_FULL_49_16]OGJ98809.1 MAG: triose-phosphate isomerase [Candidatus Raymondbacteria bacterium RIFOXYC2_FULL_50_21]OGK00328.1 MAG: triose-phosphate isomerase [Candidatus Raymondbacteria bacterium RIFOXYD12_FULL_49_13]
MRRKIIAGNWKMNKTIPEAVTLAKEVVAATKGAQAITVICPTYVCLAPVNEAIKGSHVILGAQDVHWEEKGAFTGKVSCDMLKSAGVTYVIIGHSEQRSYFNETNETVNKKVKAVLKAGLLPIICVGETLAEREGGRTEAVVKDHVEGAYKGLSKDDALKTVIAYEPVWAIGTGKVATKEQAQEVHAFIRKKVLSALYDADTASKIQIQYGGSMKADNAAALLKQEDIDGGLIGGAALKADDFKGIVLA